MRSIANRFIIVAATIFVSTGLTGSAFAQMDDASKSTRDSSAAPRPATALPISADPHWQPAPHPQILNAEPVANDDPLFHLDRSAPIGHPKLMVHVTAETVLEQLRQNQVTRDPVYGVALGTSLQGTARSHTSLSPELLPNNDGIEILLNMHTRAFTTTTATSNAATAYNTGVTEIAGRKRIVLTPSEFFTSPAHANANVQSQIVGFRWERRFGERIARQQAEEQVPAIEQITAGKTGVQAAKQFDRQADRQVARFEAQYRDSFHAQLARMPRQPDHLRFRSTSQTAIADAWFGDGVVGAYPPALHVSGGQQGVALQIHQSLIGETLDALNDSVAGQSFGEADWSQLDNLLPASAERPRTEDQRKWTLEMPADRPIRIALTEQGMRVSLRVDAFKVGETDYPGMQIQALYTPAVRDGQILADRVGKLILSPLQEQSTDSGGRRLGVRQQLFRSLLRKRFDPVFAKSLPLGPQERSVGGNRLTITGVEVAEEWATLQAVTQPADGE